jgi:hypothetical protein
LPHTNVEIEGDVTSAIVAGLAGADRELGRLAADLWFQESTDWLIEAAENRAQLGVDRGRQGRARNGLYAIAQSAQPPRWDVARQAFVFSVPHEGAVFQEFGARPHEIRAREAEVLAFEWPDAPDRVREEFEDTDGDLVFFDSTDHPGIPAIGFVRYGRDRARRALQNAGHRAELYVGGGDSSSGGPTP